MPELSNQGTKKVEATEKTNRTGIMTPILSLSPIDGMALFLSAYVDGKPGIPIQLELRDSNGDQLPRDTEVTLEWDAPHLEKSVQISEKLSNISTYRRLTLKEQQNEEFRDRTRIELEDGPSFRVTQNESLDLSINSSEEVDWSNSRAYIAGEAVRVVSAGA